MSIRVEGIGKRFGSFTALDNITLDFETGKLTALLGPSGCGKTTLLRIIAGLEEADQGQVLFEGTDAAARPIRERQVGFVFQHYALFRHMSVFENVAFGLRVKPRRERPDEATIRRKVMDLLELVQLGWVADRSPAQLSGGQRQRIALARALAVEPQVLLLDEPFGALDAQVRRELRRWLRQLHDELHITSIFVTHDQEEALDLADRIVVLRAGRIEQLGTAETLYRQPASAFVCGFLGEVNTFRGDADEHGVQVGAVHWPVATPHRGPVQVCVRPQDFLLDTQPGPDRLPVGLRDTRAYGGKVRLEAEPLPAESRHALPARVHLELPDGHPLPPPTEQPVYLRAQRMAVYPWPTA